MKPQVLTLSRSELCHAVFDVCYIRGNFKLRSGQTSTEYFDKYRFESQPTLLRSIAQHMEKLLPTDTEVLAGLEMGGIPIATALSLQTGLPVAFIRKEAKSYGTQKFAEGLEISGKKLTVVEDVVTTGGQILLSTEDLRQSGAKIQDAVCVIFRGSDQSTFSEKGLKLSSLFTMEELKARK